MAVSFMIGGNRNTYETDITGKTTDSRQGGMIVVVVI
jgi:hypothetical protein